MREGCPEKCKRYNEDINSPKLRGHGPTNTKLVIIGRDPGRREDEKGIPFIGRSGELLNTTLSEFGLSRKEVYVTNAVKCANAKEDKAPTKTMLKHCRIHLEKELEEINPWLIITLGNEAMETILGKTGINKYKNNVYWCDEFKTKVIPILHPAYILRNPYLINEFKEGFNLLRKEVTFQGIKQTDSSIENVIIADTEDKIDEAITILENSSKFCFDLETSSLNPLEASIGAVAVSSDGISGYAIDWNATNEKNKNRIKDLLVSNKIKINQNLKYDIEVLWANKIPIKGPYFDTMLAHSLLDENSDHGLEDLVLRYLDMGEYWKELHTWMKEHEEEGVTYLDAPKELLYPYAAKDAIAAFRLAKIFIKQLKEEKLLEYFKKYSMPMMPVVAYMEHKGVKINRDKLFELTGKYEKKTEALKKKFMEHETVKKFEQDNFKEKAGKIVDKYNKSKILKKRWPNADEYVKNSIKDKDWKLNLRSHKQMKELFFDKRYLGLAPLKSTKGGLASTGKEVMEKYAKRGVEVAKILVDYRQAASFLSNFIHVVYEGSAFDGRVHTNYMQHTMVTGRLASSRPNLQNLPREAYDIKSCFEADDGYVFVKADLAQAEFRCWAHYSEDEQMLEDIHSGLDIHSVTACEVFGLTMEELLKDKETKDKYRTPAKRGTFGMMFGVGPKRLSEEFDISIEKSKHILKVIYKKYPVAVNWLEEQVRIARRKGYLRSWLGRKRRLLDINSDDQDRKGHAERQAKNCKVQIQASSMNDHYTVTSFRHAREQNIKCFPCMTIHDANIFQVIEDQVNELIDIMKHVVETEFPDFRCKMRLDFEVGKTLGTLKEI